MPQKRSNKIEDLEENRSLQSNPLNHAKLGVMENGNGRIINVKSIIENPSRQGRRNQMSITNKLTLIEVVSDDFL